MQLTVSHVVALAVSALSMGTSGIFAAPASQGSKGGIPYVNKHDTVPASQLSSAADPNTANKNVSSGYQPQSGGFTKSPTYATFSAFDQASIELATHQEYIELDLFNYGLAKFSDAEWDQYGIDAENRHLIRQMAQQEIGHATVLSNMLGKTAPKACTYKYDFQDVPGFIDFCQKLTKWGESGVYGFLNLLDNHAVGQILLQSITTEARQQFIFRQFEGLFPMPEWFETGIPQSWAWTLLQKWIVSCPDDNVPIAWEIYPELRIDNNPDAIAAGQAAGGASISNNVTALSYEGKEVLFSWDSPGKTEGPYKQKTVTHTSGYPKYAAFVSQYNVTYSPLYDIDSDKRTAKARQPGGQVLSVGPEIINSTSFIALTDSQTHYTPANLSLINQHVVAGPAVYQSG
ncbi:uncharacterized protein PFL1_06294 [Pseudozyma flocculosa PF-1]|uniref:Rds1 protein n=2 Tax=Pseudozyma flocculosa TaxID=84751 RepID=A0A061H676_9BASI|nr:uncharacterized protein PFL1_06294 [Pseudozyma flocculosa PF-1]EPQ26086.1 hypothetical protein PFL1_06294 [Pseudozyma flocculosa PF-1]SPO40331.1 probable Rds1 protein [Pseudozyma flocculosa]